MQVCNNLALAGEMAAVCEALALGARLGLDPALLSGVFNASSARCWSSDSYNPAPVRRTPHAMPLHALRCCQGLTAAALLGLDIVLPVLNVHRVTRAHWSVDPSIA